MRPQITSIKSESIQYFQKHFTKQQNLHNQKEHVEQQESVVSRDELQSITETINELLEPVRTNLKFEYHEELNRSEERRVGKECRYWREREHYKESKQQCEMQVA